MILKKLLLKEAIGLELGEPYLEIARNFLKEKGAAVFDLKIFQTDSSLLLYFALSRCSGRRD